MPLISWVQAGAWCEANFETHDGETWLSCPVAISGSGYALKVQGDSMTNPGPGRSYPAGCIIFVDRSRNQNRGSSDSASPSHKQATFKVLVEDAGRQFYALLIRNTQSLISRKRLIFAEKLLDHLFQNRVLTTPRRTNISDLAGTLVETFIPVTPHSPLQHLLHQPATIERRALCNANFSWQQ